MPQDLQDLFRELETTAEVKVSVARELGSSCTLPESDQERVQHYKDGIGTVYLKTGLMSREQTREAFDKGCK